MQPEHAVPADDRPPLALQPAAAGLDERLQAACRRHGRLVATLELAVAGLRGTTAALWTDGRRRRAGAGSAGGDGALTLRGGRTEGAETWAVSLPFGAGAPGAARGVLEVVRERVAPAVLADAQLVVSELVTNSVRHSGAPAGARVDVRVELTDTMLRVEVGDPGSRGVVAPRAADLELGGGFGLNVVSELAERWGLERVAAGGTRVWAQLWRAPGAAGASPGAPAPEALQTERRADERRPTVRSRRGGA